MLRLFLLLGAYLFLAGLLFITHYGFLDLPFFWDEAGYFVPAALDLWRDGHWVPQSTTPNIHPPGVSAWLTFCWGLAGFSVESTRAAMLVLAGGVLLVTFLLSLELCRPHDRALPLLAPALLVASPLFFTQGMMAQLDMPAALFTGLALYLFLRDRYFDAAIVCVVLVMVKETGLIVPAVLGGWLAHRREWRRAALFVVPAVALAAWLLYLHRVTGSWFGNPEFAEYNAWYNLHPVRFAVALLRRLYYLFFADFRWIATALIVFAWRRTSLFEAIAWRVIATLIAAHILFLSLTGGAQLERYLMPVLPLLYLSAGVAVAALSVRNGRLVVLAFGIGLTTGLLWNPPWPFPYENNLSMVKLAWLHRDAAHYVERVHPDATIATAWPLSAGLRNPDLGYVSRPRQVVEIADFGRPSVAGLEKSDFDLLILYPREWDPEINWIRLPGVDALWRRYFGHQPQVGSAELRTHFGLRMVKRQELGGFWVEILARPERANETRRPPKS